MVMNDESHKDDNAPGRGLGGPSTIAAESAKRKGGGKLTRSETVTMRLDPKLRYLAGLAARKQRRTLSSFIEWAIEESLNRVSVYESADFNGQYSRTVGSESETLWDVDEADRFAKLAVRYPEMLTHDEQVLWKLIRENGYLWRGHYHKVTGEWTWKIEEDSFIFERLRDSWDKFNAVAKREADKSVLPAWAKREAKPAEVDDDIPF